MVIRRVRNVFFALAIGLPLVAVTGAGPAAGSSPDETGATVGAAPGRAPSKVPSLLRDVAAQVSAAMMANRTGALTAAQAETLSVGDLSVDTAGRIGVLVHARSVISDSQLADLAGAGAIDTSNSSQWTAVPGMRLPTTGLAAVMLPYDRLDAVAALPWVTVLRPAFRPAMDVGPIEAESVQLHQADKAQDNGLSGKGQKVGAMSGDVDHIADSIKQGELPKNVQVLSQAKYDDDEGTAMLEIVHDMAPKAKLAYATSGNNLFDYIEGFHRLAAAGSTLITEDLAFDDEPAFQQGLGARTAERLGRYGIWVSSSAGNLGTRHAPRVVADGTGKGPDGVTKGFKDCADNPDNVVALRDKDTTYDFSLAAGAVFRSTLQWSEPRAIFPTEGQGGFTDLNLYVMDSTGKQCLKVSDDVQKNGVGDTIEQMLYTNKTGATQQIKVAVNVAGTSSAVKAPTLDLRFRAYTAGVTMSDPTERAGSLNPDSNYLRYATSAGAVNASVSTDPADVPLETYSAAGPVEIMLTTLCPNPGPGPCKGVAGKKKKTAVAPTWSAGDGVSVSGAGGFGSGTCPTEQQGACRFFGTSAAAPSATGVATLVREELGGHTMPKRLNKVLVERAKSRDGEAFGAGVLRALS
jgi:hypothetical protein